MQDETILVEPKTNSRDVDRTPENIIMHLKGIFKDGELDRASTSKDFLAAQTEGTRNVNRPYNIITLMR